MRTDLLIGLAEDLENGDIVFDEFDFGRYKNDMACGTVGCALGHYAEQSPDWDFSDRGDPFLIGGENTENPLPMHDASEHFEIPIELCYALFAPLLSLGLPNSFDKLEPLSSDVKPEEVAINLRKAVEHYADD